MNLAFDNVKLCTLTIMKVPKTARFPLCRLAISIHHAATSHSGGDAYHMLPNLPGTHQGDWRLSPPTECWWTIPSLLSSLPQLALCKTVLSILCHLLHNDCRGIQPNCHIVQYFWVLFVSAVHKTQKLHRSLWNVVKAFALSITSIKPQYTIVTFFHIHTHARTHSPACGNC